MFLLDYIASIVRCNVIVNDYIVTMTNWIPRAGQNGGSRYKAIAEGLASDIAEGRLRPGDRLPTHRDLAYRLGVTIGTVTRAYQEALRRGLIDSTVGRGTFVAGGAPVPFAQAEPAGSTSAAIDLGFNLPPLEDEGELLAQALATLAKRKSLDDLLHYQPHRGLPAHREAGATLIGRDGLSVSPDQIIVNAGGRHAIWVALSALTMPGDTVLAEALTYAGLKQMAKMLRLRLVGVAMDENGVLPEALDRACATHAPKAFFCVPNLQNPTGGVMPDSRRHEIVDVLRRHALPVIEDDVYGFLLETPPTTLTALAPELGHYIASTSKSMVPGLRIGYLAVPPNAVARFSAPVRASMWMAPPISAEIARLWIEDGTSERLARRRRAEAEARQALTMAALAGFDVSGHKRSFHAWLTLPAQWRAEAFAAEARERGVLVTPSEAFAVSRPAPEAVRLALGGARGREELQRGLATLRDLLEGEPGLHDSVT